MVQDNTVETQLVMGYLLLRLHVSALAVGHHQVSNCASEENIKCVNCNEISSSLEARQNSRPDDGPMQGPKHVVLAINTTPHY